MFSPLRYSIPATVPSVHPAVPGLSSFLPLQTHSFIPFITSPLPCVDLILPNMSYSSYLSFAPLIFFQSTHFNNLLSTLFLQSSPFNLLLPILSFQSSPFNPLLSIISLQSSPSKPLPPILSFFLRPPPRYCRVGRTTGLTRPHRPLFIEQTAIVYRPIKDAGAPEWEEPDR